MAAGPARSAADTDDGGAIDPAKVIDITARLDPDGTLRWTPPAERWTVVRFGHTTTGHLDVSALDSGRGLEVDKLSAPAVDYQFNSRVGRLVKARSADHRVGTECSRACMTRWTPPP